MSETHIKILFQKSIVEITKNLSNGSLSTDLISNPGSSENTKKFSNHNITDFFRVRAEY